jgi:lipopolysaccharide export system protein LptA
MTLAHRLLFFLALFLPCAGPSAWAETEPAPAQSHEEAASTSPTPKQEVPPPTIFESDHGEMQTLEETTRFLLTGNVRVTGNNLRVFCDRLEVYAPRAGSPQATPTTAGGIERILAVGNVRIEQEGREALAGRAEVFPQEGRIVLTESPMIRDEQGTVTGERITFLQGEARAVVEGGESGPARITLPTIPDLGSGAPPNNKGGR